MTEDTLGAAIEELIFDDAMIIGTAIFFASISTLGFLLIRKLIRR